MPSGIASPNAVIYNIVHILAEKDLLGAALLVCIRTLCNCLIPFTLYHVKRDQASICANSCIAKKCRGKGVSADLCMCIPHNLRPILPSRGSVFLQFRANLAGRTWISDKSGVQIRFRARK